MSSIVAKVAVGLGLLAATASAAPIGVAEPAIESGPAGPGSLAPRGRRALSAYQTSTGIKVSFYKAHENPVLAKHVDQCVTPNPWTFLNEPNRYALANARNGFNGDVGQQIGLADNYVMHAETFLTIPANNEDYTFYTTSDDGSVLYVDGKLVVNNDGCHAMQQRQGSIRLSAGEHLIQIVFFEKSGGAGLKVEIEGPYIRGRKVLSTSLAANLHGQTVLMPTQKFFRGLEASVPALADGSHCGSLCASCLNGAEWWTSRGDNFCGREVLPRGAHCDSRGATTDKAHCSECPMGTVTSWWNQFCA